MGFVPSDGELRREKDERRRRIDEQNRGFGATNRVNTDNSMQRQKKTRGKGIRVNYQFGPAREAIKA